MGIREDKRRARRAAIEEAGRQLFLSDGFDRCSVERVAAEVGIARGTFYLYFDDKLALFQALVERLYTPIDQALERAGHALAEAASTEQQQLLYAVMATDLASALVSAEPYVLLHFRESRSAGPAGVTVRDWVDRIEGHGTRILRDAQERGLVTGPDPRTTALAIFGAAEHLVWSSLNAEQPMDGLTVATQLASLFWQGIPAVIALLWLACAPPAPELSGGGGRPPALVEVEAVGTGTLSDEWTALGEVRALSRAELAAGASGPVADVRVREGDAVASGDILLEVERSLALAALASAQARQAQAQVELEQAQRDLERLAELREGVVTAASREAASTRVASLEASLAGLEASAREASVLLARHRVRAPFDGVLAARHVNPGDWVSPGQPVLELVSADAVEVRVHAAPELVARVSAGMPATLRGVGELGATVIGVVPALDRNTRTALVRLAPEASAPWLVPGGTVDVALPLEWSGGGLLVSRDALVTGAGGSRVVRVVDGVASPIGVQVLATAGERAMVLGDGLSAGDSVVTRGNERLGEGQAVQVAGQSD